MLEVVERLLFIDADTVVAGSISELMTLDMSDTALAVVPLNDLMYFNSGVLLYHLAELPLKYNYTSHYIPPQEECEWLQAR